MPDLAAWGIVSAFLAALVWPAIFNPFLLEPGLAWILVCYVFAVSVFALRWRRAFQWQLTPFDYVLGIYLAIVLATWPTSVDRMKTSIAIGRLFGHVAVYAAVRVLARDWPAFGRIAVAALVVGIAGLEWTAMDYHLRLGLSQRLESFPPLEWNGRAGLGTLAAVQLALLVGISQQFRGMAKRVAAIVLIVGVVVEMLFLYSRLPWVAAIVVLAAAMITAIPLGSVRRYAVVVGVVVLVVAAVGSPYVSHLVRTMVGLEYGTEGGIELRLVLWRNAVSIIRTHLLGGVGLGNFVVVHQALYPVPFPVLRPDATGVAHPHNMFLQQAAEVGIPGGVAYVALWAVALWAAWRSSVNGRAGFPLGASLFYVMIALVVVNMGENMFFDVVAVERIRLHTIAWVVIACAVAEWATTRIAERPSLS